MKRLFLLLFTTAVIGVTTSAQSILYEGFENSSIPPTGWIATSECNFSNWYGWLLDTYAHTGNYSAFIDYSPLDTPHNSYLITPQLAISGHKMLSFWHAASYPEFADITTFTVEISTTGTNPSDFTVVSDLSSPTNFDFVNTIIDLSAYNGQNIYIAFHISDNYGTGVYIDDIDVYEQPDCLPPTNLTASSLGLDQATLTWDSVYLANIYHLEYKLFYEDWSDATSLITSNNTITVSNLQPVSYYQARIKSECGDDITSNWSQPIVFSTLCEAITLSQDSTWNEDFESMIGSDAVALNSCWATPLKSATYNAPYAYCGLVSASHSGLNSLEMRGNTNETNIVVLPAFTNDINTLKMSFFANTTAPIAQSAGTLEVGYITDPDDPTTFVALETVTPKPESFSRQSSAPYGPYYFVNAGDQGRIALRFVSNSYSTSWNFDDFSVSVLAECTEPIYLQELNITDESADLTWIYKDGYNYDVLCWKSGTQDTTFYYNVSIENGPFHIDSLMPSTSYSWIARTICSDSTYSYAATRGHFTTPVATLELPYLCNFEDTTHDYTNEFTFSGSGAAQWHIGSATSAPSNDNTPSSRSLYISEDQGLTNSYNNSSYSYAYAIFDVNFPNIAQEYHLEFDLKVIGECNWDEFSVHLLNGGTSISSTGTPGGVTLLPPTCDIPQWNHYNLIIPDAAGTSKRIVFYWHNDNYIFGNPPAAIDNILINGNFCARPTHLEIANVTENEVTLTWQENANATSWTVNYKTAYSDSFDQISVYDSTSFVLQNLTPNTDYICFVTADCDNEQVSNPSNPITFRTPCSTNGISSLPYVEDFETYVQDNGSEYVPCWSRLSSISGRYVYVNHMDFGTGCLDFNYTPNGYTIAVLPMFNSAIPLNSLRLNMDVRRHNLSLGALEVGAMSDPTDASTFEVIDTVNISSTYEWINKTVYCSDYTGNAQYLAFRVNSAGYYTVAIDNLVVDELPVCIPPSHLEVSDITNNTAQISWNGTANFFRVYLMNYPDTITYDVTENSIILNNLLPSSTYSVMVQSYCNDDTSDVSNVLSFHTQCGSITIDTEHPWFESFENYSGTNEALALSPCWATPSTSLHNGFTFPTVFNHSNLTHSGHNSLEIKGPNNLFVLPEFTNDLSTLQITLWGNTMASNASEAGTLLLGYVTDASNPNSFTSVTTIPATAFNRIGEDALYTNLIGPYDFSTVNWQPGMRIAFRYQNSQANNSWNLDDFTVSLIPDCASPEKHSVTIDEITDATATVHWQDGNASHNSWVVFYKPAEAPESAWQSDTALSNQFLTISGLTPNTTYEVYVVSYCGSDDYNPDATLTKQFTTTQVPVTIPFSTDFSEPNEWRLHNGDCENYWVVRNTTPTGNNHALFITNNGVVPGYNVTSTSFVTAEKLFTVGQHSQILIEFDVNVGGEAVESWDYDYMKMFFAPSSEEYEASSSTDPAWAASTNSVYAYNFSDYLSQTGSNLGTPYAFSLTQGNVVHISAIMDNPNPSPNASSTAKLVFAWINDYIDGNQPGAIITNLSVSLVACPQPNHLNITNIESTEADFYWLAGQDETSWNLEYKPANATTWTSVTTTTNSFHFTGLNPNTLYDVRIQADCGSTTSLFKTTSFTTSNCGQLGQCNYSFLLSDSYGDGWNGASISVMQNNLLVQNITLSGSSDELIILTLCDQTPTTLIWNSGQYDSECSFILTGPDGQTLFSISNLSTISNPTLFSFTTNCSTSLECNIPANLTASDITLNSANVSWDESANDYVLQYKKSTESAWSSDIYLIQNHYSFVNLEQNTTYNVRVKGECTTNNWSNWSDLLTFTTEGLPSCDPPTGLDTVTVSNHYVIVTWTDHSEASQWDVDYRTPTASWTTETAYANTHTISGLEGITTYQIRVRANCGGGDLSDWSDTLEVTTKNVGIDEHLLNSIKLYPNPANDVINVQCTMNNVQVEVLEVFDVYGKLINTINIVDNPTQINISGLANGMYFVRVTTEEGTVTKQFVKK